jgi:hypothetical protein
MNPSPANVAPNGMNLPPQQHRGNGNNNNQHNGLVRGPDGLTDEDSKIYGWIVELVQGERKDTALLELSKKREQVEDLAVILWHSCGTCLAVGEFVTGTNSCLIGVMTSLLAEIISVYPLLMPSSLTASASNRVCNALALLQCVASHNDTRGLFLNGEDTVDLQCVTASSVLTRGGSSHPVVSIPVPQHNQQVTPVRIPAPYLPRCHRRAC